MAKISGLPALAIEDVDGNETIPLVKGTSMFRTLAKAFIEKLATPFIVRAEAAAATAAATVSLPGAFCRPAGTALVAGNGGASAGTYLLGEVSTGARNLRKFSGYNAGSLALTAAIKKFGAAAGSAQIGVDYVVNIPKGPGQFSIDIPANAVVVQKNERLALYTQGTAFTYANGGGGDSGGYYYTAAGNVAVAPGGALNTTSQLQLSVEYDELIVTAAGYKSVESRVGVVETSKASSDAVGKGPRPLDAISSIFDPRGCLRMLSTYSGPLLSLRRADGVVKDFFPASGSDWLDLVAVTDWAVGAAYTVDSLYGQRTGARYRQGTASAQPGLTISGTKCYISFTSGKRLFGEGGSLSLARNRDGNTVAMLARLPSAPDVTRSIFFLSQGDANNQTRLAIQATTARAIQTSCGIYDDTGQYVSPGSASVGANWFTVIARGDYRKARLKVRVNDTDLAETSMVTAGKSENTASLAGSINGTTTTDSGTALDVVCIFDTTTAASAAEVALLRDTIKTYAPDYVPASYSTIWLYGDSQDADLAIPDETLRTAAVLSGLYQSENGVYRLVRNKGVSGQKVADIATRVLAGTFLAGEVVGLRGGQNDDVATNADNHDAVMASLQTMYDFVLSKGARPFVRDIQYARDEINGTTKHFYKSMINARIAAAFPDNWINESGALATFGGNTDGATAPSLLADSLHRNAAGAAVQAPLYKAFFDGKGWN